MWNYTSEMVYGLHSNNIFYHNKNSVEQIVKYLLKKVDFSSFINQNLCSCAFIGDSEDKFTNMNICLRSRPVDPDVVSPFVRLSIRSHVENSD